MAIKKSSNSGIPFGNTAARPASPSLGQPYFNGEVGRLELYSSNGWQNIVQETPGVASASGTYNESAGSGTFTISGTNFVDGAIAYAVGTNAVEYQATTTTYNSIVQLTSVFSNLSAAYEPYDIKIINPSNLFGLLPDAFFINQTPIWTTSAGSLGTVYANTSVSKTVASTDSESNTLTYASSDLPVWLSLNSATGVLTGTAPIISSDTTYTFNITVSDGSNTAVSRQFNIPVTAVPVVTGGTLSSDSTYYYRTFTGSGNFVLDNKSGYFDIFSLGGGGSGVEGGGGSGAIIYYSNKLLSVGTYSVEVGGGGTGNEGTPINGSNSRFGSLQAAYGGGRGGGTTAGLNNGAAGGSGGGGRRDGGGSGGASNQDLGDATSKYGFAGGTTASVGWAGAAGGGGTGAAGSAGSGNGVQSGERSGKGGAGTTDFSSWISAITPQMSSISGWASATTGGYIGGGGTGGQEGTTFGADSVYTGGAGGGGGAERYTDTTFASNGVTNTGGGGGGKDGIGFAHKAGGSGLVIVRYTKASLGG